MVFGFLKDKELDNFARDLANDIHRSFPPTRFPPDGKLAARDASSLVKVVQRFSDNVQAYQKKNQLGLVKRLKLSNAFQTELAAFGYGDAFVREVTLRMTMILSGRT